MIEHGIVLDGRVLPGTEWVLRDTEAWWDHRDPMQMVDLRERTGPITLLGYHWTGGPSRMDDEEVRIGIRNMKARRRPDGSLMDVSCSFLTLTNGSVFQTCDLRFASVHMGRAVNQKSVGVEQAWPGYASQAKKLREDSGVVVRELRGRKLRLCVPDPRMIAASVRLAQTLTDPAVMLASGGLLQIPRTLHRSGPPKAGAIEHYQAPNTTKDDCAGVMLDALRRDGWR